MSASAQKSAEGYVLLRRGGQATPSGSSLPLRSVQADDPSTVLERQHRSLDDRIEQTERKADSSSSGKPGTSVLTLESGGIPHDDVAYDYPQLSRGRGRAFSKSTSRGKGSTMPGLPPELDCTPIFRQTLRFQSQSATSTAITGRRLGAAIGCVASSTTNLYPIASSFRVLRVDIYPGSNSDSATRSVYLLWEFGSAISKDCVVDGSIPKSTELTGRRTFVPPKESVGSMWVNDLFTTGNIMYLQTDIGSIVDITVEATVSNALAAFPAITVTGPATAGTIYWPSLDSTNRYLVSGRTTIT